MFTGWKTVILNVLVTLFGALVALDWTALSPTWGGLIIAAVGAINVWLRTMTNTPVGTSEKLTDAKIEKDGVG